ncbi:MAG: nuclear transport factor 2 family protein [Mycobacteriales bacterium]|nr:nuclear transport factor 2 family protein [Mycobacteriales bacterium]
MPTTRTAKDLSVTTTEHPNAKVLRDGFAAFGRGDLDTIRATMTDDAVWTNAGTSALAGTYRGWDAISGMFGALFERTGGTISMQVVSVLADDAHACAIYDSTSTIAGQTQTNRFVLVQEMTPDGKARATQTLAYDQAAADAHLTR